MKNDKICHCTAGSQLRALVLEDSRNARGRKDSRKLMKCLADFRHPHVATRHTVAAPHVENQALLEEKACQQFE